MFHRSIGLAVLAVALGCSAESAKPGSDVATPSATLTTAVVKVTGMT